MANKAQRLLERILAGTLWEVLQKTVKNGEKL
jgi:hypothetical protein